MAADFETVQPGIISNARSVRQQMANGYVAPVVGRACQKAREPVVEAQFSIFPQHQDESGRKLFCDGADLEGGFCRDRSAALPIGHAVPLQLQDIRSFDDCQRQSRHFSARHFPADVIVDYVGKSAFAIEKNPEAKKSEKSANHESSDGGAIQTADGITHQHQQRENAERGAEWEERAVDRSYYNAEGPTHPLLDATPGVNRANSNGPAAENNRRADH